MYPQYRPSGFSLLPAVVKNLLIINGLMFLAQFVAEKAFGVRLEDMLGLHYPASMDFRPWQFITYMFLHGDLMHVFFNMFALWMFGYLLENIWGPKRFLVFYFVTGIGAALVQCLVMYIGIRPDLLLINQLINNPEPISVLNAFKGAQIPLGIRDALDKLMVVPDDKQSMIMVKNFLVEVKQSIIDGIPVVIGASGAVFGILLAFGMLFPNTVIYLYFFFPVKAKYFVIGYGLLELYFGVSGTQSNVAHFAHLGGMVFGFFLILYWKKRGNLY